MTALELGVALVLPAAIVVPHLLPIHRVAPATAAAVWLLALALRALVAIGGALFVFVYLPQTGLFHAIADLCLHEVVPLVTAHVELSGHPFAHLAVVLPGLALAASLLWMLFALARAWVALRLHLRRRALGEGPQGTMVVADSEVIVAVPGVGRSRVVVSEAALGAMDDEELRASLAHERGHLRRRHRPLLLLCSLLAASGRLLPGTAAAKRQLVFSLERDADEYAVRTTGDPLALASAICKAAGSATRPALAALAGKGGVTLRLEYLTSEDASRCGRRLERSARLLATALAALTLGLAITLPGWALAAPSSTTQLQLAQSCLS